MKKNKKQTCSICGSILDIYTTAHQKNKFIDYKNYDKVCFTCYFVPKTKTQKYDKDGCLSEEVELEYSCDNLNSPKELLAQGHAETLKEAKTSYAAVCVVCKKKNKNKSKLLLPKADWHLI